MALEMDYKFKSVEQIFEGVKNKKVSEEHLQAMLNNMEKHGAIFVKIVDEKKAVAITTDRCIGCGVCVSSCKSGALRLKKKDKQTIPPKDMDTLYDIIMENKKGTIKRALHFGKAAIF